VCIERGAEGMLMKPLVEGMVIQILKSTETNKNSHMAEEKSQNERNLENNPDSDSSPRENVSNETENIIYEVGSAVSSFELCDSNLTGFRYPESTSRLNLLIGQLFIYTLIIAIYSLPNILYLLCFSICSDNMAS
jgi:hypothetical protein